MEKENPLVMYLIVKQSLNMSSGKTAAQCAHASQMMIIDSSKPDTSKDKQHILHQWLESAFRKVVLSASDEEFEMIKQEYPVCFVVTDMGLTEITANTETVIGLFPIRKNQSSETIKALKLLK